MSAELAIGDETIRRKTDKKARIVLGRVVKEFGFPYRQLVYLGDAQRWPLFRAPALDLLRERDPRRAEKKREGGEP